MSFVMQPPPRVSLKTQAITKNVRHLMVYFEYCNEYDIITLPRAEAKEYRRGSPISIEYKDHGWVNAKVLQVGSKSAVEASVAENLKRIDNKNFGIEEVTKDEEVDEDDDEAPKEEENSTDETKRKLPEDSDSDEDPDDEIPVKRTRKDSSDDSD